MDVPSRISHKIKNLNVFKVHVHVKVNRFVGYRHIKHPGMIENKSSWGIGTINPQVHFMRATVILEHLKKSGTIRRNLASLEIVISILHTKKIHLNRVLPEIIKKILGHQGALDSKQIFDTHSPLSFTRSNNWPIHQRSTYSIVTVGLQELPRNLGHPI